MAGLIWFLLGSLFLFAVTWLNSRDEAYCVVSSENDHPPDGFYYGDRQRYIRANPKVHSSFNDVFDIFSLKRGLDWGNFFFDNNGSWRLVSLATPYVPTVTPSSDNEDQAPSGIWVSALSKDVVNVECVGSLSAQGPHTPRAKTNIGLLILHPVSTIIIAVITGYAYYLFDSRVDVSAVSFSYAMCIQDRQLWRAVTASFAHFDLMHYAFNTMSVFQLAPLEEVYTSMAYGYLSVDLIFITIAICAVSSWAAAKYGGRPESLVQQSVGYSCVLFAWMVAISVRMPSFCPVTFVPQLCFSTWHVPVPGTDFAFPVNAGPFVLLVITKLIIPRSSFVGHLSGIIIGFPLAWNCLNWLTPPVLAAVLALYVCAAFGLWPMKGPCHAWSTYGAVTEFVESVVELNKFRVYSVLAAITTTCFVVLLILSSPLTFDSAGVGAVSVAGCGAWLLSCFVRLFCVIVWFIAGEARLQLWQAADTRDQSRPMYAFMLAAGLAGGLALYDLCNLGSTIATMPLLSTVIDVRWVRIALALWSVLFVCEMLLCVSAVLVLTDLTAASGYLRKVGMDGPAIISDIRLCRLECVLQGLGILHSNSGQRGAATVHRPFSGVGHRLQADAEAQMSLLGQPQQASADPVSTNPVVPPSNAVKPHKNGKGQSSAYGSQNIRTPSPGGAAPVQQSNVIDL